MSEQYQNYLTVLSDLRLRKSEYEKKLSETNQAIALLEGITGEFQNYPETKSPPRSSVETVRPEVAGASYSGMKLGEAAASVIRSRGPSRPLSTREIVEALKQGGVSSRAANLFTTMYNVLSKRSERENSDIVKSGTGWTLREFQQGSQHRST